MQQRPASYERAQPARGEGQAGRRRRPRRRFSARQVAFENIVRTLRLKPRPDAFSNEATGGPITAIGHGANTQRTKTQQSRGTMKAEPGDLQVSAVLQLKSQQMLFANPEYQRGTVWTS